MPSVAEFVTNDAETTLKIGKNEIPVVVRYRPNEMTTSRLAEMDVRQEAGDMLAFLHMFEKVVIEFDLEGPLYGDVPVVDAKGNPVIEGGDPVYERQEIVAAGDTIPVDAEILQYMSMPLLGMIWRGLAEDQSAPDPQKSRGLRRR